MEQPRKQRSTLLVILKGIGLSAVVALLLWVGFGLFMITPISWGVQEYFERKGLYPKAEELVEQAGGWQAIETASLAYSTNAIDGHLQWLGSFTNDLPSPLAALRPKMIMLVPNQDGIPVMAIHIFGGHRTGSYDSPYYGIWVVCTNVPPDYVPPMPSVPPWSRRKIERKGDAIFEVW